MADRLGKVGVPTLTDRQRRFADEYLVDCVATKAAVRAGYSPRTADRIGARLLRHPGVAAHLAAHAAKVGRELDLTIERLERELACVAFFDPVDIFDGEGHLLPLKDWPESARRAAASFEEEALFDTVETGEVGPRGGKVKERLQIGVTRKVKWLNKVEALQLAMKRLGMLTDRHEFVGPKNVSINIGTRRAKNPV